MRNIRSERDRLGMTQVALAERLGVGVQTVKRWEAGSAEPRGGQLASMSGLFGCSVDYLLGRTEERL